MGGVASVAVIVPWRPGCPHREAAWQWVRARYEQAHPGWELVEASAPEGPWVKALAVMPAVAASSSEIVVVADADVWCEKIGDAVDVVRAGEPWAVPHKKVHRLSRQATDRLYAGHELDVEDLAERPYRGTVGGGLVVLPRASALEVPLDPRFVGWGGEDQSWGYALNRLIGRPWLGMAPLWHLWHPPQQRMNRRVGSTANHDLHLRYAAARQRPDEMRKLLEDARCRIFESSSTPKASTSF